MLTPTGRVRASACAPSTAPGSRRRGGISHAPGLLDSSSTDSARGLGRGDTTQLQGSGPPSTQEEDRSPSNIQRTADAHRKLRGSGAEMGWREGVLERGKDRAVSTERVLERRKDRAVSTEREDRAVSIGSHCRV